MAHYIPINSAVEEVAVLLYKLQCVKKLSWYTSPQTNCLRHLRVNGPLAGSDFFVSLDSFGNSTELFIQNAELGEYRFVQMTKNERYNPLEAVSLLLKGKLDPVSERNMTDRSHWSEGYAMVKELRRRLEAML